LRRVRKRMIRIRLTEWGRKFIPKAISINKKNNIKMT